VARDPSRDAVYDVAECFRQRCLVQGKSLLWPKSSAWTLASITALRKAFIENPDTGKRSFIEKLHDQLLGDSEDVHRVAADLIAFYYLFPSNIGIDAKLKELNEITSWKLSEDKPDFSALKDAFERGLGQAGLRFSTGKPWQFAFLIQFSLIVIRDRLDPYDGDSCKRAADLAVTEVPLGKVARNMLLHLFFPDEFERIVIEGHRRQIIEAFGDKEAKDSDEDIALLNIRTSLKQKLGRETVDFYDSDIYPSWGQRKRKPVRFWIEKTNVRGRADREHGQYSLGKALWSPQRDKRGKDIYRFMRDLQPGDVVFHLVDNEAFTAISRVETSVEEFQGVPDTEWGVGKSYLVQLHESVLLDPPLKRSEFFASPFREQLLEVINTGVKNLFYNKEPSLNQGAYLTPAPEELVRVLDACYAEHAGKSLGEIFPEIANLEEASDSINAWIFQANPGIYDIRGAIDALTVQSWSVTQFKKLIKTGDTVYIWESGSDGGIK